MVEIAYAWVTQTQMVMRARSAQSFWRESKTIFKHPCCRGLKFFSGVEKIFVPGTDSTPQLDAMSAADLVPKEVIIKQTWSIGGGLCKRPVLVPETDIRIEDGKTFIKLAKGSKWLPEFVTGLPTAARPLSRSEVINMLRQKAVRAVQDQISEESKSGGGIIAALGLDEDTVYETPKKKKKNAAHIGGCVEIHVPTAPGQKEEVDINVLTTSFKEAISIEFTEDNLSWARNYIVAEISAKIDDQSTQEIVGESGTKERTAFWCQGGGSGRGQWRVRFRDEENKWRLKCWTVSREPAESFKERSAAAEQAAECWVDQHLVDGQFITPQPTSSDTPDVDIHGA